MLLSTTSGTLAALGITRLPRPLRIAATGLIPSPLTVPRIVVAIGIYYSCYGLVGAPIAILLTHTCLAVPFEVTTVRASLAGADPRHNRAGFSRAPHPEERFGR